MFDNKKYGYFRKTLKNNLQNYVHNEFQSNLFFLLGFKAHYYQTTARYIFDKKKMKM